MKDLFGEGHEHMPEHLKQQMEQGNEEICHMIMVINSFLKSQYPERDKNEFLKSCAGSCLETMGRPPIAWLEELRGYMMVNLKS